MKHFLLQTTAIAGVMFGASPGMAQDWDLDVHGFFQQHVGYASNDLDAGPSATLYTGLNPQGDYDETVLFTNAEVHFTPSVQLDNGLTFGVNIQLEGGNNGGDTIDESFMTISSERLGKLVLGSTNSAGFKMMVSAPVVTSMAINSPSSSAYIPFSAVYGGGFREAGLSSATEVSGNNDAQRITYFSPSFNGFMVGLSYAPTGSYTNGMPLNSGAIDNYIFDRKDSLNDIVDIAMSYSGTLGQTSLSISGRYGTANWGSGVRGRDNPETWGIGAQLGYSAFTIGGSYAKSDNGAANNAGDSHGWNLGATYDAAGPWSFELVTYQGRNDNGTDKEKYEAYRIGASRDIGPGVDVDVYGLYTRADNGASKSSGNNARVKGWGVGTAVNLKF